METLQLHIFRTPNPARSNTTSVPITARIILMTVFQGTSIANELSSLSFSVFKVVEEVVISVVCTCGVDGAVAGTPLVVVEVCNTLFVVGVFVVGVFVVVVVVALSSIANLKW